MKLSTHVTQHISAQGMPLITVAHPAASLRLSLFGGHILSYVPNTDKRERLWLSSEAVMDGSKAIRGGIPVCWPWFAAHSQPDLPAHGYLRTQLWQVIQIDENVKNTRLVLQPEFTAAPGFEGQAGVSLIIEVGDALSVTLVTENTGEQSFTLCAALHTYFRVNDIEQVELMGLEGEYIDKLQQNRRQNTPSPYTIDAETDRIHLCQTGEVVLKEPSHQTPVGSSGHDSIVVWNPGLEKAQAITDMPDNEYQHMLCIETAITQGIVIAPGHSHHLTQVIK
ncbi:D-hexose-6-phosphate mutarotase [Lacimicrobium sp. SS2-24]|uniref:D-hexose-6-phosphate mutarotase n=1 Tax=Lacimicrobium sp. SS2-24 TaxID=2005569 RepID=UPI00143C826A|nr:D-hexose-6-phosphate mutarotase [Lacimicrobium sp. SS2-24]